MIQLKETGTELCAAWKQGGTKSEFDSGGAYFEAAIACFHSRGQHLYKCIGTKENVCIRKEFNSQRIGLGHQHCRRDVM